MAFEIGTASSTFDLYDKLRTFMTTVNGWSMHSNIDGYNGYDTVYYSKGSHGSKDIFIRHRAKLTERFLYGLDQYDYNNGDTGYINFFSYGHFPQNGDAYAGSSEVGSLGPRVYWFSDDSETYNAYFQHILSQQVGGTAAGSLAIGGSMYSSLHTRVRRRWVQINDMYVGGYGFNPDEQVCFDGKRYFYFAYNVANDIYRYSIERDHSGNSGYGNLLYNSKYVGDIVNNTSTNQITGMVVVEHRDTRRQYLYIIGPTVSADGGFRRIRLDDNSFTVDSSISDPVWPLRSYTGGTDSVSNNGCMAWDGADHIYFVRGGFGAYDSLSTPDWGMYKISTNTWTNTTNPNSPAFTQLPFNTGGFVREDLLFVDKRVSGFANNRLYIASYASEGFYYMDVHGDTGMPLLSSWTLQTITQDIDYNTLAAWRGAINRAGKLFLFSDHGSTMQPPDDFFPSSPERNMLYGDLQESGQYTFNSIDVALRPDDGDQGMYGFIADGYISRVRTAIGSDTDYVFIGNEDRIMVATKSDGQWSLAYMGAIDSFYGHEPIAELAYDVGPGISKKIILTNTRGQFTANMPYTIIGSNTESETFVENQIYGFQRRYMNSENIMVTHVGSDYVIASIKNAYKAGDKIGIDPQPVGVWSPELYKFFATNIFQTLYDSCNGSNDPSLQTYDIYINDNIVSSSNNNRNLSFTVWPIQVATSSKEASYKAQEVRGSIIGAYALSTTSSLSAGDTIYIGERGYYIISIPNTNSKIAIGPLE